MAGVAAFGAFERIPIEVQTRLVEVNLIGTMNGAHAALPWMLRRGRGVIVNMSSLAMTSHHAGEASAARSR
jgi:short-subunit dehydrogenase